MIPVNASNVRLNAERPEGIVKLVFVHHSCGESWLADGDGGLALALMENNYFVSSTNYGWGPDKIGDRTDIGHWWEWFLGEKSAEYTAALYAVNGKNCEYTRPAAIPAGENEIVLFKSCYPNSFVRGSPADAVPDISANPLRGKYCDSEHHTVGNAKSIYLGLLDYFKTRQDKLFVLATPPPVFHVELSANARALNRWLVYHWLEDYPYSNVAVFDLFNVLTSNCGEPGGNDAGMERGNHHRFKYGMIEHRVDPQCGGDTARYAVSPDDEHPTKAGNRKATEEFVALLNIYYNNWKGIA
jgi:hypothetical protein